ncbi:MAG: hypothetical protein U0132_08000 [Gemmatimonadaceae bacterium]
MTPVFLEIYVFVRALGWLLVAGTLVQGKWKEIGTTSSSNPVSIDPASIKRKDGIVTATVRVVYQKPVAIGKKQLTGSRSTAMFDCAKQSIAVKENVLYADVQKGVVYSKNVNAQPGYGPAIKGSFADVAMQYVCKAETH